VVTGIAIVMYGGTVNVPTVILSSERRNQRNRRPSPWNVDPEMSIEPVGSPPLHFTPCDRFTVAI
jgi:hypothetical protein